MVVLMQAADSSVAAAEMLAIPSSDTGDDVSIYQLKWVEWMEEFAPIVVQVLFFKTHLFIFSGLLVVVTGIV